MMEDLEFRNFAFENAEPLEIKLETKNLTSMLKGQYGAKRRVETPSSTKRQNYRGIGQAKSSKPQAKPREEEAPTTSRASSTSSTYSNQGQSQWLSQMISNQMSDTPVTSKSSKPPKKSAKQAFKFKCNLCGSKYKTKGPYENHLRKEHQLVD